MIRGKIMGGALRFRWPDVADYNSEEVARPIDFGSLQVDDASLAFYDAAELVAPKPRAIVDALVKELRYVGIWSKFRALWPFVGGTALSNSINLVDPDTYQLTYSGSPSHALYGLLGHVASGAYADTGISILSVPQFHFQFGVYVRTAPTVDGGLFASSYTATGDGNRFYVDRSFGQVGFGIGASYSNFILPVTGLLSVGNQDSGPTGYFARRNGALLETKSGNVDGRQAGTLRFLRHGSTSTDVGLGMGFYLEDPLTLGEEDSFKTIVQRFDARLAATV